MEKFDINVVRTGYGFKTISVEANSLEEAEEKALDEAGSEEFSEKTSEYSIEGEVEPNANKLIQRF